MDAVDPSLFRDIEQDATIIAGPHAFRFLPGEDRPEIAPQGKALNGLGVRCADGTVSRFGTDIYRHRRSRPIKLRDLRYPARPVTGPMIYGGVIGPFFGHQITQSMGRLWVCDEFPQAEIAFLGANQEFAAVPGYFVDLMRMFGITNPVRLLQDTVRVAELIVPQDRCNLHRRPSIDPAFAEWLASHRPVRRLDPGLRLYVSRSGLDPSHGQYLQETVLEEALAAEGYRIIRPEQMPLQEQVDHYLAAGQLIFADGSAVHLWSLFGQAAQRAAMVLRRAPDRHIMRWFDGLPSLRMSYHDHRIAEFSFRGRPSTKSVALLDLTALWRDLKGAGFHQSDADIGLPRARLDRWIGDLEAGGSAPDTAPIELDRRSQNLLALRPRVLAGSLNGDA